jgi:hypothetical protein
MRSTNLNSSPPKPSISPSRCASSQEDLTKVVELLRLRPIQFCIFLKALLGEEAMERLMSNAIAVAKQHWFQAHAYIATWCSPLIALVALLIRSPRTKAGEVDWLSIILYVVLLSMFPHRRDRHPGVDRQRMEARLD